MVTSGFADLDQALPQGGFRRGTLVEWLAASEGGGTTELALQAAREACREGGSVVIFDPQQEFYPLAAARAGIALAQLIVVQPASPDELRWALTQTLRCPAVAASVAWIEHLADNDFRRLQLAAEEGQGLGFLLRPATAEHRPSWADVRLWVEPLVANDPLAPRRWRVTRLRCRGGGQTSCLIELGEEYETHLVPQTGDTAGDRRRAGA